jgi:hypothetical protein
MTTRSELLALAAVTAQQEFDIYDQKRLELILVKHIAKLETVFIAVLGEAFDTDNIEKYEMALKFQEATRKAVLSLNEIRNPKKSATFIKNAIAQQVNQLVTSQDRQQNKLGDSYAPQVDISAETETERIDRDLATLEKVNRGAKRTRKTKD